MHVCIKVKDLYLRAHLSGACTGYNYVPVNFYFSSYTIKVQIFHG